VDADEAAAVADELLEGRLRLLRPVLTVVVGDDQFVFLEFRVEDGGVVSFQLWLFCPSTMRAFMVAAEVESTASRLRLARRQR